MKIAGAVFTVICAMLYQEKRIGKKIGENMATKADEELNIKSKAAMEAFQALFSDEKARKSKEQWKDYFLSETFLDVQFSENFMEQMRDSLKKQNQVPYKELPPAFLFELATAYGLEPLIDEKKGQVRADFMEAAFYEKKLSPWRLELARVMRTAAKIWNAQDASWRRDRGGRTIRKWEYRLRERAFEDYIQLCIAHDAGVCDWEEDPECGGPLTRGMWEYIQTGRFRQNDYGDFVRNECILMLYAYFLRTRKLPESAYVWLWKRYKLSEMKAGQQIKAYDGIRQAILSQCPSVETMADQEKLAEEQYHSWTQRLYDVERKYQYDGWAVKPRVPYEYTYALSAPKVSEQERMELQELVDSPVFQAHKYDDELVWELDYHCVAGNCTLGMAEKFYDIYMDSRDKNPKISMFLEHIRVKLSYFERIPEYLCWEPCAYDCSTHAADFWYYYLITAFEGRCTAAVVAKDFASFRERGMIRNRRKYLSGYLEQLYQPSMEWRRRFVGSDRMGRIEKPRCMEISLCPEKDHGGEIVIGIEFWLHSIRFYWNGVVWNGEETLSFQDLLRCAGAEGDEEHFVLLLALTDIDASERELARGEIRNRLEKLPIDAFSLDFVAECLANGNVSAEGMDRCGGCSGYDDDAYDSGEDYLDDDEEYDGYEDGEDYLDDNDAHEDDENRLDVDEYDDEDYIDDDKYGADDEDYIDDDAYDDDDDEYDGDDDDDEYDGADDGEYDGEDDDDEYDEEYQDFDYNAYNDDVKNGLDGQDMRFAEDLTGLYRARRDASGGIVYSKHCFCGWQSISPSKWSLWEECRGLARYGLGSLNLPEKKRVMVKGMSDLEKAQQICALLEENHQLSMTQHRKNQQWLEKCGFLAGNSVVLCYGDRDSCYLEKTLNTGLYTEKKSMEDPYAMTKKEKNYQVGWLLQNWDSYKTVIAVGESGALWYYEKPSAFRATPADSLAEIIAKRYRLEEVTAIYVRNVSEVKD